MVNKKVFIPFASREKMSILLEKNEMKNTQKKTQKFITEIFCQKYQIKINL